MSKTASRGLIPARRSLKQFREAPTSTGKSQAVPGGFRRSRASPETASRRLGPARHRLKQFRAAPTSIG
eukprot:8148817-Alexandrium_andersonii.AAC.1